jgi:hypothetical protein
MDDERDEHDENPTVASAAGQATGDGGPAPEQEDDGFPDPREGREGKNRSSTTTGEGGGAG